MSNSDNKGQHNKALLTPAEAADFLGVNTNWLEKRRGSRAIPGGPSFVRLGGFVRYHRSDLDKYVSDLERVTNSQGGEEPSA